MPSLHHIVVLGDGAVGKTALTIQYCLNNFVEHYDPTIEDSYRKQVNIDGETCVLEILDTAGQEEYSSSMGDQWLRRGDGFLLIYSITSRQSFARIKRFREQLARVRDHSEDISIVLVGNKCDMAGEREVSTQEGLELANRLKCEFIETSAKTKYNVESAFHLAVRSLRKSTHHKKKKGDCAIL
ncbi:small G-protein Ras2 [Chytriomyces cf. hyalinus JEL632]|nr:small G-protein Ras2 [Chytriomyces cf. hyalinus JEL632]